MIDRAKLMREAGALMVTHLDMRPGQALMNALAACYPEQYHTIRGSDGDCFYNDDLIGAFWGRLEEIEPVPSAGTNDPKSGTVSEADHE